MSVFVLVLLGTTPALAQDWSLERAHFVEVQARLAAQVGVVQGTRVRSARLEITPIEQAAGSGATPFATRRDGELTVHLPAAYLANLGQFLTALHIESAFDRPDLTQRWMDAWPESILYEGRGPRPAPQELAQLTTSELAQLDEQGGAIMMQYGSALEFVFAHELGHHALDAYAQPGQDNANMEC